MSLYRKYRPMTFKDLVGQDHIKRTLQAAIAQDKIAHSYLFAGPRGVGKTTVARILAKAANCTADHSNTLKSVSNQHANAQSKPCGKCQSCITIAGGQSMDIIEIDAASNRGIDEIRELRDKVRFTPSSGRYKVYIIDEVHMLTKEAFNALLKTLEEPPPHAIFIMATTEGHKVPATIISRCQRFDFKRATPKDLLTLIGHVIKAEKMNAESEALSLIARAADGAHRDALTLLEQIASDAQDKITADLVREKLGLIDEPLQWQFLGEIFSHRAQAAMKGLARFGERGIDWKYLLSSLNKKLRLLLFYQLAPDVITNDLTPEESNRLKKISQIADESSVVAVINMMLKAEAQLKLSSLPELPLGAGLAEYFLSEDGRRKTENGGWKGQDEIATTSTLRNKTLLSSRADPPAGGGRGDLGYQAEITSSIISRNDRESDPSTRPRLRRDSVGMTSIEPLDQAKWQSIIGQVKKTNLSLARLLAQSHPFISGNEIIIEVPYKLWEEKVKDNKNKKIIIAAVKSEGLGIAKVNAKSNGELKKKLAEQVEQESAKVKADAEEIFG